MGAELSKHKDIIPRIERMLQLVHEHELTCGTNTLHNKSHEVYLQLKADDRIIRKCEQAG